MGIALDGLKGVVVSPSIILREPQFLQLATRLYLGMINHGTLSMDETQDLIITVGQRGISTACCLIEGDECTGQFVEGRIGASEDVLGAHLFVGITMAVEIIY